MRGMVPLWPGFPIFICCDCKRNAEFDRVMLMI